MFVCVYTSKPLGVCVCVYVHEVISPLCNFSLHILSYCITASLCVIIHAAVVSVLRRYALSAADIVKIVCLYMRLCLNALAVDIFANQKDALNLYTNT